MTLSPNRELSEAAATLTTENCLFLRQFIQRESGIALGDDKEYLLRSRLSPIVIQEQMASLNELCERIRKGAGKDLRRLVVEAITTHETLFFRDASVFEMLSTSILPDLIKLRGQSKELRIWSAACSSGQEPYSIAMLLRELGCLDWKIEIVGTDISSKILERAAEAKFLQIEVNRGLPSKLLLKYFEKNGREWRLTDNIRKMVRFSLFDLRADMRPFGFFDLVLCRNVLIYFDRESRRKILAGIRGVLSPGGYLLLGSSETTYDIDNSFARREVGQASIYRVPLAAAAISPAL
jgi:chemotaxis protein methyltransferase CheR